MNLRRGIVFVLLACLGGAAIVATFAEPVSAGDTAPSAGIAGVWTTDWGGEVAVLTLNQNGSQITGGYTTTGAPPGNVQGTLVGNVLSGTWSDQNGGSGGFSFTFAADFRSFRGTWGSGGSATNGGNWDGRR